jgi:hypothetical protein
VRFKEGNPSCQKDGYDSEEKIYTHETWLEGLTQVTPQGVTSPIDPNQVQNIANGSVGDWFDFPQQDINVSLEIASSASSARSHTNDRSEVVVLRGPDTVAGAIAWAPTRFESKEEFVGDIIIYQTFDTPTGAQVHPNQIIGSSSTTPGANHSTIWWVLGTLNPVGSPVTGGDRTHFAYSLENTMDHEMAHVAGLEDTDVFRYLTAGSALPGVPRATMHDDECEAVIAIHHEISQTTSSLAWCSIP